MKKLLALVLVALFAFSLCAPLSAEGTLLFYLETDPDDPVTEVDAGDQVEITVSMANNPGIANGSWYVTYDVNTFAIVDPEEDVIDSIRSGARISIAAQMQGEDRYSFNWFQAENNTRNGAIATLVFTVDADAVTGDYDFNVGVKGTPFDRNGVEVPFTLGETYTIHVNGTSAGGPTIDDFTAGMSATVTSTDATANLVIGIPEGADLSKLTVAVDGVAATLPAAVNGQIKLPTAKKAARNLAEQITYTITYDGASKEITTSLADYAAALAAGEDAAAAAVGQAMLNYGAAARAEFDKTGDAPEIVGGVADGAPAIVFDRFDATALNAALRAPESTVSYTALTATYETEITLSMALRVNDNFKNNVDAAAQWVADNFKIDGKDVAVSTKTGGGYTFVVITVGGIAVDDVKTPMAITVANADAGTVCVANYLASVEAAYANNPAKAGQLNVARALFAYATALEAIA